MSTINELSQLVLILIRSGAILRISYLFLNSVANENEVHANKKRIKNVLKFYVVAECIFILKDLILSYY